MWDHWHAYGVRQAVTRSSNQMPAAKWSKAYGFLELCSRVTLDRFVTTVQYKKCIQIYLPALVIVRLTLLQCRHSPLFRINAYNA